MKNRSDLSERFLDFAANEACGAESKADFSFLNIHFSFFIEQG